MLLNAAINGRSSTPQLRAAQDNLVPPHANKRPAGRSPAPVGLAQCLREHSSAKKTGRPGSAGPSDQYKLVRELGSRPLGGRLRLALIHYFDVTVAMKHSCTVSVFSVSVTPSFSSPTIVPDTESTCVMQPPLSSALQNCPSNWH